MNLNLTMKAWLGLLLLMGAMLASCQNKQIEVDISKITGDWKTVEVYGYVGYQTANSQNKEAWQMPTYSRSYGVTFNKDGHTYMINLYTPGTEPSTGTYSVMSDKRLDINLVGPTLNYTYDFSQDTLILSDLVPRVSSIWKQKLVHY